MEPKKPIVETLDSYIRKTIRFLYGWISKDSEALGYILGVIHILVLTTMIFIVVLAHTWYPLFWFKCVVFVCILLLYIQHICLDVCVLIVSERKLTNNVSPYFKILEDLTGMNLEDDNDYLVIVEGIMIAVLGTELVYMMFQ